MISFVIVSHSAKLAEGICELAAQMTQGQVPLAAAGGISDPENPLGTDTLRVQEAIQSVYSEDGVIVLMDLGSALLSADMALEFLPEEQRANVHLCEAPLVEGTVTAAVHAMASNDIEHVLQEARGALHAKALQLGMPPSGMTLVSQLSATPSVGPTRELTLTILNSLGLHARPAAQFVQTASRYQAQVTVRNLTENSEPVNGKSINQLTTLGIRAGHQIVVAAQGSEAEQALDALVTLIETGLGDRTRAAEFAPRSPRKPGPLPGEAELHGIAASPGVAIGPLARYRTEPIQVSARHVADPQAEWQRLQTAISNAEREIGSLRKQASRQFGDAEAAIFDVHSLFLKDPALVEAARHRIFTGSVNAESAWQAAVDTVVASYQILKDPYLQARELDVRDVGGQVLTRLVGVHPVSLTLSNPSVLAARELPPSAINSIDPTKVLGICTERGSPTSHSAILARAMGVPMVVGLGPGLSRLGEGTSVALDGHRGKLWTTPDSDTLAELQADREAWLETRQKARAASHGVARTRDGRRIGVMANVARLTDVKRAVRNGAEGIGLLRTEFLFLDRTDPPSENDQFAAYQAIAEALGPRPLVIRTMDIGGDKPLSYLDVDEETNPFLGWRGIRVSLAQPELFKAQLRAILRASPGHLFRMMFPMISSMAEILGAKSLLHEAQAELRRAGIPFDNCIEVGIMIEVPSAVVIADQLATQVDFFSIGTNDLTQCAVAADRTNPRVAALADPLQPAILRMIRDTVEAAHAASIRVGLCGELAADPLATPLLLGLGLDELSMNSPAIPLVKQAIAQLTMHEVQAVIPEVLALPSASAVREHARGRFRPQEQRRRSILDES